jgi:GNAT superfamily N-acetyltransferase
LNPPITKETIHLLREGLPIEKGPKGLTIRIEEYFHRREGVDDVDFILEAPDEELGIGKERIGEANSSIHHRQSCEDNFRIGAKSAVLWDIQVCPEWRRKGIGSECLRIMKEYAKLRGAERFYAADVQTEFRGFFVDAGFAPTDDSDWWILREF